MFLTNMKKTTALVLLHIIVLLWGCTSILGELISYNSVVLVWWRLIIVCITLSIYYLFSNNKLSCDKKLFFKLSITGAVVGIHWLFFYGGIKVSNISITLIALSSITFFTSLLEPLLYKRKLNLQEVGIGICIVLTITLIGYRSMDTIENSFTGMFYGISAAFTAAIFSTVNGKLVKESNAFTITYIELFAALICVSIGLFVFSEVPKKLLSPSIRDLSYLLLLGILCTAVPFLVSVEIMKKLTPFTVNLSLNLETVYSIVLAYFIFNETEKMTLEFYIATIIILLLIILNELSKKRKIKHEKMIY